MYRYSQICRATILSMIVLGSWQALAAGSYVIKEDGNISEDLDIVANSLLTYDGGKPTEFYALFGIFPNAHSVSFLGNNNSIVVEAKNKVHSASKKPLQAVAIEALGGSNVVLGNENSINTIKVDSDVGVWAVRAATGSKVMINGKELRLTAEGFGTGKDDAVYGLYAQNTTYGGDTPVDERATLIVNAETTVINVSSALESGADALVAMSEGILEVNGNLYATADNVIIARGGAKVGVNRSGTKTVQLNGDINFNFDKETSDTPVDSDVTVNLTNADSYWTGNSVVTYGTGKPTDEQKLEVKDLKLELSNGARWNPTVVKEHGNETEGVAYLPLNHLNVNDGVINLKTVGQTLEIDEMAGTGGTINLETKVADDGSLSTGLVTVNSVAAGATPAMTIKYDGVDSDALTDENVKKLKALAGEGSEKIAVTEHVAEGNIRGAWTRTTDAEGNQTSGYADNAKLDSFQGVNASALVLWRNQINHLTKRLGDVRHQSGDIGAWARVYGGEYKWGDTNRVDMQTTTVQVGGDARVGDWIVGGAFSYSDSSYDLENGDGDGDLYSLAVYGTRTFEKGSYVDFVARYGYIKNDIQAGNMDVDFDSNAFSLSVEGGHTFKLMERAYVEPQIEVTYGFAQGDDATASNGVKIEQDDYQNLITRIGFRTGFDFPNEAGTIYAHASYSYDFLGEADGTASQNGLRASLDEDLGGGWVTYGIGGQFRLGESTFAYGELERSTGGDVDNPWAFNVGLRHLF